MSENYPMMECIKIHWGELYAIFQDLNTRKLWRVSLERGHVFLGEQWYSDSIQEWGEELRLR